MPEAAAASGNTPAAMISRPCRTMASTICASAPSSPTIAMMSTRPGENACSLLVFTISSAMSLALPLVASLMIHSANRSEACVPATITAPSIQELNTTRANMRNDSAASLTAAPRLASASRAPVRITEAMSSRICT
ncbi:Uncharacterised protein [Mycobacteroides abscessus subsp. abscessus]|nr:Uncharacterised protein [Mycobacteroides abscessus subsp. abscessus]